MTSSYSTDIVIFGGGIAGLWVLNCLRNQGYQAILLETDKLGAVGDAWDVSVESVFG